MSVAFEMARIVRDVRKTQLPELSRSVTSDELDSLGKHRNRRNLGALAIIAQRMYGLLPENSRHEQNSKTIQNAYANWLVAASILDDIIDNPKTTQDQKVEYLLLGIEAFIAEEMPKDEEDLDTALSISLRLFQHAGSLLSKESYNEESVAVLSRHMQRLCSHLIQQDYALEHSEQQVIASEVGGMCFAAPIVFAEALQGEEYKEEIATSFILGAWAQKLDNLRDIESDLRDGEITAEVLKVRQGESRSEVFFSSLKNAIQDFKHGLQGVDEHHKQTILAMANLILVRYMLIHPVKSILKHGKLYPPGKSDSPL